MFRTRETARAWVIEQKKTSSYTDLAKRLGMPLSTIRSWCIGTTLPNWAAVRKLGEAKKAEEARAEKARAEKARTEAAHAEKVQKALLAAGAKRRAKAAEALSPEPGEAAPEAPPPSIHQVVEDRARAELAKDRPNVVLLDLLFRWMSRP